MGKTLQELADYLDARVIGDPSAIVHGLGSLDDAVEGQVTFLANPKYAAKVAATKATAVILPPGADGFGRNVIETPNPYLAFAKVLTLFCVEPAKPQGVMDGAMVGKGALLGQDITVYPGAYLGEGVTIGARTVIHPGVVIYDGVTIGADVTIHSNATVRERCRIGDRVIIHNGAVIGSDGFGYAPDKGRYYKIPQIGIVVLEDDVEIGANSTVDRAALDKTIIRRGAKIDNLVQIAHNCIIGEDTAIAAQAGVAGSAKIGNNVTIGGQSAVAGHLAVGDNIILAGRAGVTNSISQPGVFSGLPAIPHKDWLKASVMFTKLPEMRRTVSELEKRLAALEIRVEKE